VELIRSEVLIGRRIVQDADFRAHAMAGWFEKERHRDHMKPFNSSAGSISNFKKCHRFTSRAFHDKRRSSATADRQEQWRNRIEELLRGLPHDLILNTDEMSW
jgi:hypothetical protein